MTVRLSLALVVVAVVGASLIPATAAADLPTEEEFSPVGDQFVCDETLVTVKGGTVLERDEFALQRGFFHFKVNLIGGGGLFGTVDFLLRRKKNGEEVVRDRGPLPFALTGRASGQLWGNEPRGTWTKI